MQELRLGVMRERIVVYEDGADLLRDAVVRETEPIWPALELAFAGTGPARGDWEDCFLPVEYIPPGSN